MVVDNVEELIREIAAKHGVALGRNDPILMVLTMNEKLFVDSAASQQVALDRFKEELESIAHRWGEDARNKAERTLNAALTASKTTMKQSLDDEVGNIATKIGSEVEISVSTALKPVSEAKKVAVLNLIASIITLFAAIIIVLWGH